MSSVLAGDRIIMIFILYWPVERTGGEGGVAVKKARAAACDVGNQGRQERGLPRSSSTQDFYMGARITDKAGVMPMPPSTKI
jgi:hypothetical protein